MIIKVRYCGQRSHLLLLQTALNMEKTNIGTLPSQVLEVVLELLLNEAGQLDPLYSSHQPLERRQQNIPHLLHHHLNHPSNAALGPPLLAAAARIGPAATRLLRLLCCSLFQPGLYSHRSRLARGAYAQVRQPPRPSDCLLSIAC